MNCPEYDPDAYGCMSPLVHGRCPNTSTRQCENGWMTFWTPAERAGLKAMGGRVYSIILATSDLTDREKALNRESIKMIRAYIQAARKSKEE